MACRERAGSTGWLPLAFIWHLSRTWASNQNIVVKNYWGGGGSIQLIENLKLHEKFHCNALYSFDKNWWCLEKFWTVILNSVLKLTIQIKQFIQIKKLALHIHSNQGSGPEHPFKWRSWQEHPQVSAGHYRSWHDKHVDANVFLRK